MSCSSVQSSISEKVLRDTSYAPEKGFHINTLGNVPYYIFVLKICAARRNISEELSKTCLFNPNPLFCKLVCLWKLLLFMEYLLSSYRTHLGNAKVKTTKREQRSLDYGPGSATNLHFSLFFFPHLQKERVRISDLERKKGLPFICTLTLCQALTYCHGLYV